MNTKSKSLLAVMAVALMLGCGLVPAIADNGVAEETKDASSEATGVNNLADFLDIIENGAYAANLINFDGVLLKPVINDVRDAPQEIETEIYDEVHKTSGTWTIGDGDTISFHNKDHKEGTLYFDAGSTLVLFPMGGAQGFNIRDCYSGTGNDSLVILMPGSCLNIFGTTFMVLGTDEDNSIELFGFAKRSESDLTMNIQYDNQTDNKLIFTMIVKGDKVASAYINAFAADPSVNPDCGIIAGIPFALLSIDGKLSAPEKGYGFIISEASLTSITYGEDTETSMPMYKYAVMVAGITVNRFEYTYTVNDNEANGKISLDLTANNGGVIAMVSIMDEVQIMGSLLNFEFKTGDILFNISENPSTKRTSVSIAAKQSITLSSPRCGLGVTIGTGFEDGVVVSDLKVSADNLSFSATGTDSGELIDLDASMSINGSYKGAHHHTTVDGEEFYLMENDSSFTVGPISLTVEERTTTLNIEQMTVRGICNGATLRDFNVEYSGSLKNVVLTENKNSQTLRFDCDAYCRAVYNGKERVAKFAIENAVSSTTEDGAVFGIDTILLEKDIPNSIFEEKFARYLKEVNIPDYIKFEVKNLRFDSEAADVISVESMYVGMKNISVFNEVTVELNGNVKLVLKTDATGKHLDEVKCSEIKGTYKNITMPAAQKFSIDNNPEVQVTNGAMRIIKGDARFGSGLVPMTIVVDKDASFTASELTANLVFVEGCKKSGQVRMILETIDGQTYSNSLICLDGANITYMLTLADNGGYNVTVGLDKLTSGTVTAKKGFILPAKYDGDGYSMKSDDGKTGSLNIADYGAKITIPTQRNSFTLSYENNFAESKTYRYLDTVTITQSVPEKEGMTFIGWTDGSRTGKDLIQPGDQYVMPARDVTLKPVYMKTVTPEVVKDGDKVILVVAESEANAIQIATDVKNWDVLEVKIKDVTVEMTKDTYDALGIDNGLGVIALSVDKFNNDYVESVIGNKKVYGIELMNEGDVISENSFNQKTEFKVTVNLKTDSSMKGFNVRYFDAEYGFFEDVGSTHTRNNDGTYDVTFTVNHFSLYAIEPVQENTVQNLFTLVAIIIVIILVCVAVGIYIANRKSA